MIQLAFWHEAILRKSPNRVKQRVKLKDIGLVPTVFNPIMGSPLECMGTVTKVSNDKARVKWDNNRENIYPLENLVIADFPLKFMPKFVRLDDNNPNITFKELEHYKLMEKEWYAHEERMKVREDQPDTPAEREDQTTMYTDQRGGIEII